MQAGVGDRLADGVAELRDDDLLLLAHRVRGAEGHEQAQQHETQEADGDSCLHLGSEDGKLGPSWRSGRIWLASLSTMTFERSLGMTSCRVSR